jgi:hypothetical protein
MIGAALQYAAHGWPIFPVRPRGKEPLTENGFHDATTDQAQIRQWWADTPAANIGFPPGRAGLIVFDWDSREGQAKAVELGLYAVPTLVVRTARGEHIYTQHPGWRIGNRKVAGVLDVRADAGYVLLPPSVHPSGATYHRVLGSIHEIVTLPPAALDALRPRVREPRTYDAPPIDAGTPRRRAYVSAAIESECIALAQTGEGDRNNALNRAAFTLARFIETGEADAGKLADLLAYAARNTGLDDDEIERTIHSASGARGVAA